MSTHTETRRYYYAYTLACAIDTLGIPERTPPTSVSALKVSSESVAAMVIHIARMDVHSKEDADRAAKWVGRVIEGMKALGYWSTQQCESLLAKDKAKDFHLPLQGA